MKKIFRTIIKTASSINLDMTKNYKLYRKLNKIVSFGYKFGNHKRLDYHFDFKDRSVPVSFFIPDCSTWDKLIIYFHGGGWVIGDVQTYTSTCSNLANETKCLVALIDYRLAPEYPFPHGLKDCYDSAKRLFFMKEMFGINSDDIILMGDSAGANIAAVISIMAVENKGFLPKKQILLYPVTNYDHSNNSPYYSVIKNGNKWGLTAKRVEEYMKLYAPNEKDRKTKYVSPLLCEKLINQPKTLIITAEYDPLRDEGEAYGHKLRKFGNEVEIHRVLDCIHGFFSSVLFARQKKESFLYINNFINEGENHENEK